MRIIVSRYVLAEEGFESLASMSEKISLVFALPCHLGSHMSYLKRQITTEPRNNYNTNRVRSLMCKSGLYFIDSVLRIIQMDRSTLKRKWTT